MKYSKIFRDPTVTGRKPGLKPMIGNKRKKEISNRNRMKKQEFKKKKEKKLGNIWDNLKRSNIGIIGVPEGEEQQQDIENLFEKIRKENFPNLSKEMDFQESRKPRESQRSWTQGSTHQGTSSLSYPRLKLKRQS